MENFNFKKYLAEGTLLKEENELSNYRDQYPEEIKAMDKEIEELKAKLEALIKAKNKAKSDFTKSQPAIFGQGEYAGIKNKWSKSAQYNFKSVVDYVKNIAKENGNDWEILTEKLKSKWGDRIQTYTKGNNRVLYVVNYFLIQEGEDKFTKENPSGHIKIGNWYMRPW
jgi:Skp family chaperone for outer membrane proteins